MNDAGASGMPSVASVTTACWPAPRSAAARGRSSAVTRSTASVSGVLPAGETCSSTPRSAGTSTSELTTPRRTGLSPSSQPVPPPSASRPVCWSDGDIVRNCSAPAALLSRCMCISPPMADDTSAAAAAASISSCHRVALTNLASPVSGEASRRELSPVFIEPLLSRIQYRTGNTRVELTSAWERPAGKPQSGASLPLSWLVVMLVSASSAVATTTGIAATASLRGMCASSSPRARRMVMAIAQLRGSFTPAREGRGAWRGAAPRTSRKPGASGSRSAAGRWVRRLSCLSVALL